MADENGKKRRLRGAGWTRRRTSKSWAPDALAQTLYDAVPAARSPKPKPEAKPKLKPEPGPVLVLDELWSDGDAVCAEMPDLEAEFTIPGYELLSLLGRGGMGEVYLANRLMERPDGKSVAVPCVVKTIIEGPSADEDMQELFLDEARICAQLRHPNVVTTMDVGQTSDRLYLTLEWVDGIDGLELIRSAKRRGERLPLEHVLFVVRETLKGLHHAHTAVDTNGEHLAVVHRDISPGNILISRAGAVKLADFGVALGRAAQHTASQEMTVGKPGYIAAEVWQGKSASVRSDIFAMGVTLYEMLTLGSLFDSKGNLWAMALDVATFDPQTLLGEPLTPFTGIKDLLIKDFLVKTLSPDPEQRYASALEFLEDINDFCYETGVRLLDVHFAAFVERIMASDDQERG